MQPFCSCNHIVFNKEDPFECVFLKKCLPFRTPLPNGARSSPHLWTSRVEIRAKRDINQNYGSGSNAVNINCNGPNGCLPNLGGLLSGVNVNNVINSFGGILGSAVQGLGAQQQNNQYRPQNQNQYRPPNQNQFRPQHQNHRPQYPNYDYQQVSGL